MPSNKPPALAFAAQIRFTERQRRYLLVRAAREGSTVSEVVRRLVDEGLRNEPLIDGVPMWVLLQGMNDDQADELARKLQPWGEQEPVV